MGVAQAPFEIENAADGGQGHSLVGESDDVLDENDLLARVASLSSSRPLGPYDLMFIEPAQERLLHAEHRGDLADRVKSGVIVVDR